MDFFWIKLVLGIPAMLALLSMLVYAFVVGISPIPSSKKAKTTMLSFIPKDHVGNVVDLGSGWGTLVFAISKKFPQSNISGYELSPLPWLYSILINSILRRKNLTIHRKNIYDVCLSKVNVVVCYLHPSAMAKLALKFEKELPRGTLIVCNTFPVPSWPPKQVHFIGGVFSRKIYVYEVK